MPPLKKIMDWKITKVYQVLTHLPHSRWHGATLKFMSDNVMPGEARRYLSILTIINSKHQSNLSNLDEESIRKEQSIKSKSPFGSSARELVD